MAIGITEDDMFASLVKSASITLEGAEKHKFFKAANEAIVTQKDLGARTAALTSLYKDIQTKSLIDFDTIPLSKGDFTKYKYFETATEVLNSLNAIFKEERKCEEIELMNKIYNLLISLTNDFKYGFLHDIDFLKLQYNTLVLTLHEIQNICILSYLKFVRDPKASEISFGDYRKKDLMVIRGAREFVAMYERGEWSKLIKSYKSGHMQYAGEASGETSSDPRSNALYKVITGITNVVGNGLSSKAGSRVMKAGAGIAIGATLFMLLRYLVFYFYNKAARVSDTLKLQVQFLDALKENPEGMNPKTAKRAAKVVDLANRIVGVIDNKIFKANNNASRDLTTSDRALAANITNHINDESMPGASNDNDFQLM